MVKSGGSLAHSAFIACLVNISPDAHLQERQPESNQSETMLRHLKRRQQELEGLGAKSDNVQSAAACAGLASSMPLSVTNNQALDMKKRPTQQEETKQQKRVRGRRSSKPAMEKRRRARINECLDILKSYVLNDTTNLNRLGIDLNGGENQLDEESIARQILKSSGLINRHRGRKNPNKLEKADILELTVDYVRRLHEQRDGLLLSTGGLAIQPASVNSQMMAHHPSQQTQIMTNSGLNYGQQMVPAHLNEPLTLDLSPKSRQVNTSSTPPMLAAYRPPPNTPLTPPSSASSLQGSGDVLEPSFQQQHQNQLKQMQLLSQVLDGRYKLYPDWVSISQINDQ